VSDFIMGLKKSVIGCCGIVGAARSGCAEWLGLFDHFEYRQQHSIIVLVSCHLMAQLIALVHAEGRTARVG